MERNIGMFRTASSFHSYPPRDPSGHRLLAQPVNDPLGCLEQTASSLGVSISSILKCSLGLHVGRWFWDSISNPSPITWYRF